MDTRPLPLRVLLVDDHEVVRQGLRSLIDRQEDMEVVAEASSVAEAIQESDRRRPDIVVMDIRLSDGSGVEACRDIRSQHPDIKVIMLTSYADDEAVVSSIVAGASGYLLKQVRGRDLVEAIRTVGGGGSLLDPAITQAVLQRVRDAVSGKGEKAEPVLTPQEERILSLIAEGMTNKEIAEVVYLSDKTVKNYVSNILTKLDLSRRSQAAAYLARRNKPRLE